MSINLVGIWSTDQLFGPGAQSDEILVFKPDGTGRLEFVNFVLCTAYEFRWQLESENCLTLIGTRTLQLGDDGKPFEDVNNLINVRAAPMFIDSTNAPNKGHLPVLRVKLMDMVSDRFGLIRRDLSGYEEARFD